MKTSTLTQLAAFAACALGLSTTAIAQTKTAKNDGLKFYEGFLLSSNITGSHVKNLQNADIGTIDNLIVNPETGRLRFAVLSVGGFLGIGDTHVVVPWTALTVEKPASGNSPAYVLDTTKGKLEKAPRFDPTKLTDLYNRVTAEPIFTYYDIIWFPDVSTAEEQSAKSNKNKSAGATTAHSPSATPTASPTASSHP